MSVSFDAVKKNKTLAEVCPEEETEVEGPQ
jgi:hypothetical protein